MRRTNGAEGLASTSSGKLDIENRGGFSKALAHVLAITPRQETNHCPTKNRFRPPPFDVVGRSAQLPRHARNMLRETPFLAIIATKGTTLSVQDSDPAVVW